MTNLNLSDRQQPDSPGARVAAGVDLLFPPGGVTELRCIKTKRGTIRGYFDDPEALFDAAVRLDGQVPNVYITLNPVLPDLLARAVNRVENYAHHTTSDDNVVARRWFAVDLDAKRPAGISATEEEHWSALERAANVGDWLTGRGWPEPVVADSGNGGHLLYGVDLPNDRETTALLEASLKALSFRFSDEAVDVDVKTGNPSRIWKLYGTRLSDLKRVRSRWNPHV